MNNTEIGNGNSAEDLKVIDNLTFDKKGEIQGNTDKAIFFEFRPMDVGFFSLKLLLSIKNVLYSPPIVISFEA